MISLTKERSTSKVKLMENSISILQEKEMYGNRKISTSLTNDLMKRAIKVSMSINRGREYSKPIELNTWRNRLFLAFIVLLSILVGVIQVTQSGLNIALGIWLKNPVRSAFLSFIIGDICLLPFYFLCNNTDNVDDEVSYSIHNNSKPSMSVSIFNPNTLEEEQVIVITPSMTWINMKDALKDDKKNWIIILNGALGTFFVCSVIYISPLIGFSLYYIAVIIGQIICSMLIDNFGLFWSIKKKLTLFNIIGSILTLSGAVIFQIPGFIGKHNYNYDISTIGLFMIALFSGSSLTVKSCLDRKLKKIMNGTAYQSTFLSFMNSTILLFIINIIVYIIENDWFQVNNDEFEWWIFCGGLLGPFIVTIYIIAPSYIGFVATFILAIFGSLITSFIFDIIGAFGINAHQSFSFWEFAGIILVLIGSFMVNIRRNSKIKKQVIINNNHINNNINNNKYKLHTFDIPNHDKNNNNYLALTDHEDDDDLYSNDS